MTCIHKTQFSQMLNGFSLDLKHCATALREPGSRLELWCQSCPMTRASCALRSSSGCQRTLTKVTPVGGNGYSTHLNQSPSQNFQGLVLLVLQLRGKIRRFALLENLEEEETVLSPHLNYPA